ncbi:helicase-related protein [uncultured Microbacterium sp.]|uniref:helicase-related protein n=1 Tax=uncultured Microbacterium sp. TaxID=191216 RepID=UPI0026139B81|nr:helicase-related protein [uncultured Microbacterium sp.]
MTDAIDVVDFEPAPITDAVLGRSAVTDILRARWLGPHGGPDELLDRNPVYAYLVGTLYPIESGADVLVPTELVESEDPQSLDEAATEVSGEDPSDDPEVEDLGVNITGAFGWAPQSFGMSFMHHGTSLTVRLAAGVYDKEADADGSGVPEPADEHDGGKKPESWRRRPIGGYEPIVIDVSVSGSLRVLEGRARLSWRTRASGDRRLTTVSVSNDERVAAGEAKRHAALCLFQVSMSCTAKEGMLPYPQGGVTLQDEDQELVFRYRGKPIYAIGHGTAVDWDLDGDIDTVRSETIPQVEVAAVKAREGEGSTYKMRRLADDAVTAIELAAELAVVAADYRSFIARQTADAAGLRGADRRAAERILSRQGRAAARIEEGIALLAEGGVALTAFRMANAAMRWQMLRQRRLIDLDARYGSRLDADFGPGEPMWRPFQLAFILASLASTVDADHEDRGVVDLIWFPTGGGKTEAYLGLAATEMIRRRLVHGVKGGGMAVLTRYTMRLLTAQQFQRAATLICALELMRHDDERLDGTPPFLIGLWLGNTTTPGTFKQAKEQMARVRKDSRPENPFQLLDCPWCGHRIMPERHSADDRKYGVRADNNGFTFFCPDGACPFTSALPVQVVDEGIYAVPPTLLVATVDKLARLAWIDEGGRLFGASGLSQPPSLVIQDELHLLSGPLGTIVGVYEAAISALLRWKDGRGPKVVASTATTRASERQMRELMAKDRVEAFPPAGLDDDDNHFSEPDLEAPGRLYLGLMPQAHTPSWAVGQIATEMLDAPDAAHLDGPAKDAYWTLVVYHNSLRELGRTVTILRDDVSSNLARRESADGRSRDIRPDGVEELNGNVDSSDLIALLQRLETTAGQTGQIDALATTNIMSVGIDVTRLGMMLVNGHTKTTAEYIQATSRVGRAKTPGLVVTMFRSGKPRDRSVFESFGAFHRSYYRFVEPSSVTPWSTQARRRALRAALIILVRHAAGLNTEADAHRFDRDDAKVAKAVALLKEYVVIADPDEAAAVSEEVDRAVDDWVSMRAAAQQEGAELVYSSRKSEHRLMRQFDQETGGWPIMNSMRTVDRVVKVRANGERNV